MVLPEGPFLMPLRGRLGISGVFFPSPVPGCGQVGGDPSKTCFGSRQDLRNLISLLLQFLWGLGGWRALSPGAGNGERWVCASENLFLPPARRLRVLA